MKIVAEIGASHNGSLDRAIETIDQVHADCVKFQLWTEPMAVHHRLEAGLWRGWDLVELYEKAQTPAHWLPGLFSLVREYGMIPMCSPFDRGAVDILEGLDCPIYKIASFEAVDLRLIDYVASTKKPIVISTGQVETHEIRAAVETARRYTDDITLLHCVSDYPTSLQSVNLKTMNELGRFYCDVGVSDHSLGSVVPIMAATLGASMLEKHVSLDKKGLDGEFAMQPEEFNRMASNCRAVEDVMGEVKFSKAGELRRSLYWARDLKQGETVKDEDLVTRRPNQGLSPIKIDKVINQVLKEEVYANQPVMLSSIARTY